MRIVVTNKGKQYLESIKHELESENEYISNEKRLKIINLRKKIKKQKLLERQKNLKRSEEKNLIRSIRSGGSSQHGDESYESKSTEKNVKQRKIQLPKSLQEKYNSNKEISEDSIIIPNLPPDLINSRKFLNKDGSRKKSVNVKDILSKNTVANLKLQKLKNKRVKELNTVITNDKFRTDYGEKDVIEDLLDKLDVEIDSNKINLIKYLYDKKEVSEKFIKQFELFSEKKLNKLNKICQIISYKKEHENINNQALNEKIKIGTNRIKREFKDAIDNFDNSIKFSNAVLKTYNNKVDKNKIYGFLYGETKQHWIDTNVEKLQRKTNREEFKSTAYSNLTDAKSLFSKNLKRQIGKNNLQQNKEQFLNTEYTQNSNINKFVLSNRTNTENSTNQNFFTNKTLPKLQSNKDTRLKSDRK